MTLNVLILLCLASWACVGAGFIAYGIARGLLWLATRGLVDTPVPYWPADPTIEALIPIVMCPLCRDDPKPGTCTCTAACGHPACVYAHVELTGLSEAEERFVNGKGAMP